MTAPNFFILGAQKTGVPFLIETLSRHPDIFLSPATNPCLFAQENVTAKSVQAYEKRYFSEAPADARVGEGATTYLQWPHALANLQTHIKGTPRFVVSLRQPTDKAIAFFIHNWRRGRYAPGTTITDAFDMKLGLSPLATSLYGDAIKRWLDAYPPASFCFITYDQLVTDTQGTLRKITDFLDAVPLSGPVKPYQDSDPDLAWAGKVVTLRDPKPTDISPPRINRSDLTALHDRFAQDIEHTAALTGLDLSKWHKRPKITPHKMPGKKMKTSKPRFIFHVGFPKCGSTSIFTSLRANLSEMNKQKVFVLNDKFNIATKASEVRNPLWQIQEARQSRETREAMVDRLRLQIKRADGDSTLIFSSEVLGEIAGDGIFDGFDDIAHVDVIGYFRPQISWIPSAWKQWQSRDGITLKDATDAYVADHKPDYLGDMNRWQTALPKANTILRPFLREELVDQSPLHDFMTLIDFKYDTLETESEIKNPSIDYALLHLMMLHHSMFFTSRHDSKMMHALVKMLPPQYLKTNAIMLNTQMQAAITDGFRADNEEILSRFLPKGEVATYFEKYFTRPDVPDGDAYPDFAQDDILQRARDIIKDVFDINVDDLSGNGHRLATALHGIISPRIDS